MDRVPHIIDNRKDGVKAGDICIVRNFSDVFPKDLLGLPLDREIKFAIEIVVDTKPISMAPYCMVLGDLKEIKV